jgi:hypothetical protein
LDASFIAPSAVWINATPSPAFLKSCRKERPFARIFSEMAKPAASSDAWLIREPEDSFSRAEDSVSRA